MLEQAVRLSEGEGFIRSFVDEGTRMAGLLSRLRARERRSRAPVLGGETISYIDRLVASFGETGRSTAATRPVPVQARGPSPVAMGCMVEPLSDRELEVPRLLAQRASNADVAEQLVVALNTVKRHTSNIFEKLGASN